MDAVIRKHTARRDDWNRFRELFDKTHPLFLKNLKEAYPGLSETQVRLATYIHTGMDNKQIADFLNIRAESVKQSRWRLRSRMGLQPGESLEDDSERVFGRSDSGALPYAGSHHDATSRRKPG